MSSSSSEKELEQELKDDGERLLMPPSSIDELLVLLDKVDLQLSKVEQAPSKSMKDAIRPSMKALISNELLRHSDINVKVSVISCLNEITRITAPDAPYDDEKMKEIFQLTVMTFEKLSHVSGRCYTKAVSILDTVAKVRSCLVMLDLECDELVVEMFKLFLNMIRSNHPYSVFLNMETIMTLVVEESEEISVDLLRPLLASVKKENQNAAPICWKLAEKVIKNCAAKLKPYLQEAVLSMGIAFDDYAEVVTSIIEDASRAECLVAKALVPDAISSGEVCPSGDGLSKSVMNDGTAQMRSGETLNDSNSLKTLEPCQNKQHEGTEDQPKNLGSTKGVELGTELLAVMNDGTAQMRSGETVNDSNFLKTLEPCQNKQHEGTDARIGDQSENFGSTKGVKLGTELDAVPKKRGRKPNSLIKPEEGYDHSWISGGRKAVELTHPKKNHEKKIGASSSKTPASKEATSPPAPEKDVKPRVFSPKTSHDESISASPSQNHSFPEGSHRKRGRPKKKGSMVNQDGSLDSFSAQKGVLLTAQLEENASESADVTLKKESEGRKDSKAKPERGSSENVLAPKTKKETTPALGNVVEKKEDGIPNDPEGKQESSIRQMDGKKRSRAKTTSEKHVTEESGDKKMVSLPVTKSLSKDESPMDEVSKTKCKGKRNPRNPRKGEVSETPHGVKDYGEELVGCKIKVWWPMDQTFYEGAIHSFDPATKKHRVLYADGDEEILNLRKEHWELVGQTTLPDPGQEIDLPNPDALSDMLLEKKAKIAAESSIKQETADTLSKSVGASASKSKVEAPKSGSKPADGSTLDKDDASKPFDTLNADGQKSTGKSKTETPKVILKSMHDDASQIVTKSKGGSKPTDGSSLDKDDASKPFETLNADGQKSTGKSKTETPKIIKKSKRDASQIVTKSKGESAKTDNESHASHTAKQKHVSTQEELLGDVGKGKLPDPVDTHETETLKIIKKSKRDTSRIVAKSKGERAKAVNESRASNAAKRKHVSTWEELSGDVGKGKLPDAVDTHETQTLKIVTKSKRDTSQIVTKSKGERPKADDESHASDAAKQKHVSTQEELSGVVGKGKLLDPVETHETEKKSGKKRRRLVKIGELCSNV